MRYIVAGVGYTGRRVLAALPADRSLGLGRSLPSEADANHEPLEEGTSFSAAGRSPGTSINTAKTRRLDLDLSGDSPPADLLQGLGPCTVLYTIPPRADGDNDKRLALFLSLLGTQPERIVYLSTSGVYGDRQGRLTDETVTPRPATERARRRLAAETTLGDWCEQHGVEWTILRVPGIYGPGRLGLSRLRAGGEVLRAFDAGPGNRIHVDDLTRCCLAAMQADAPAGLYNLGDGDIRSSGEFSAVVAELAGLPAPTEISLTQARQAWSPARLSFIEESRQLDLTRMRDVLGVRPLYANAEDGIRASLDEEAAA